MNQSTVFFKQRSLAGLGRVGKNRSPRGKCEACVYLIKYKLSVQMEHKAMRSAEPRVSRRSRALAAAPENRAGREAGGPQPPRD